MKTVWAYNEDDLKKILAEEYSKGYVLQGKMEITRCYMSNTGFRLNQTIIKG